MSFQWTWTDLNALTALILVPGTRNIIYDGMGLIILALSHRPIGDSIWIHVAVNAPVLTGGRYQERRFGYLAEKQLRRVKLQGIQKAGTILPCRCDGNLLQSSNGMSSTHPSPEEALAGFLVSPAHTMK